MRKRITAGLVALAAGLVALATTGDRAAAQPPKANQGATRHLYGHDLKVRPGGERDWPKAVKVGVELFKNDAYGAIIGISDAGDLATFPAPSSVGSDQTSQWLTAHDLNVRKAGEANFTTKTKVFGVEVFKDLATNELLYACQTKSIAFAPGKSLVATDKGPKWHHGLEPKVRAPGQQSFDTAKRFGLEVFTDENTGGLIYITETGAIATAPPPATSLKFDPKKIAAPKPLYGLDLRVRAADEPDFTDKTRRVGVEVFEDPNTGVLFYLTDAGFIATAPSPGKLPDDKKGVTWKSAMNLKARQAGQVDFAKATSYGVEVFQDNRTGNLIFIAQTGSIAVLAK